MSATGLPVLIIAGPTASGKSARAVEIAAARGGIVINADSLQIYDALPILTAQPSVEDLNSVPHALYGTLPPQERCTAQIWRDLAAHEIDKAHAMGKIPVVTGGTGFYIETLMRGLSPVPKIDAAVRGAAIARQQELGNPAFHAELAQRDPAMAARLHPNDTQRLIRACEVLDATGKSLAEWQALPAAGPPENWRFEVELLIPPRDELNARCDARFDAMMENGAPEEVEAFDALIQSGALLPDAGPVQALGFKALQSMLRGEISRADAVTQAKTQTRQYARRQITWFRGRLDSPAVRE